MTNNKLSSKYFTPIGSFDGIDASVLKITAVVLMLMDHASVAFIGLDMNFFRFIARIAFPVFAYLIAEGAVRTRSIPKYLLRLGVFAIISEVPFDLILSGTPFDFTYQNVYFTLFFGLLAVWATMLLKKKNLTLLSVIPLAAAMAAAYAVKCDYGETGVLCIYMFYIFSEKSFFLKLAGFTAGILSLCTYIEDGVIFPNSYELPALMALVFIMTYNGQRGVKINKYFFYGFYPAHLLVLWLLTLVIN